MDNRIKWNVESLVEIFKVTDADSILEGFSKNYDPLIHFYEDFLASYDPSLRKSRGVWYTPTSVVNFIVDSVDRILIDELGIKNGLANSDKTTIEVQSQTPDRRNKTA